LVGNLASGAVDASVSVPGPPLAIQRTYISHDNRRTGAFGAGWASPLDQRLATDGDGSGNVVVTLANGRTVRFGRNADGSFSPPHGANITTCAPAAPSTPVGWRIA
jgi:hypothetical protein